MIAMRMLSGEFAGTTGDQSFGEAISADCIIEYEISGDKVPLIEGYRDLAEPGSVREALHELGCSGGRLDAQKLGQLLSNPTIIEGIHAVNQKVHTEFNLGPHIMNVVVTGVPNPDPISQRIINGNTDEFRERYFGQVERDEAILYDLLLIILHRS